ncbi:MAG: WD40 repeat domain-containing serine/threonine-protein kinase [Oscillatoriaceae bacterium SKW80]|nr:WD40 repeat domain-containing serine/threonine-protein kinase [Oscillatoriaceae bacterium SKYG93]MCX8121830.1 WD40 repeat domain-containing serine/threonine-protein kinase [Oscillatoriaceae bacterium SKW80]MDW8454591.1 WD40 repeat domain-containing serine/threonine-protein kinase [Oscillatoriaceae cyanobacterium SKYGB_i_bin93]HIK27403.1 hypothetical protein [Oscillatoriaceae cyanobacterium M7585_C2015_266]
MSLCINPFCPNPKNPDNLLFCPACGSELLLEGRYRVRRQIGEGVFNKTYEVSEQNTAKVLKVLTNNIPEHVEFFTRQALILSKFNHSGIPKVEPEGYFTVFPKNSNFPLHCLVMERIEGIDLETYIKQRGERPIPQKLAIEWLRQLINILQEAYSQEFFYWNIVPSKIAVKPDGNLALIDFRSDFEIANNNHSPSTGSNWRARAQSDFSAVGSTFVFLLTGKNSIELASWRASASHISPLLLDFIDELIQFPAQPSRASAEKILQRLAEIEAALYFPKLETLPAGSEKLPLSCALQNAKAEVAAIISPHPSAVKPAIDLQVDAKAQQGLTPEEWAQKINLCNTIKAHSNIIYSVAISPDGQTIVSGSRDYTIKVWHLVSGKCIHTFKGHLGWVHSVALAPDSQVIVSGSDDNTIKIWSLNSGQLLRTLKGHSDWVKSVALAPDGETIVSGSYDGTIKVWSLNSGQLLRTLNGHCGRINCIAIAPNGQILVSGAEDKTLNIWNLKSGERLRTLKGHSDSIVSIAIATNGKTLVSASYDNTLKVWNLQTGEVTSTLKRHSHWINCVAIASDSRTAISASADKTLKVWNLDTGRCLRSLKGHSNSVFSVAISPDDLTVVSGGYDGTLKVWQIQ